MGGESQGETLAEYDSLPRAPYLKLQSSVTKEEDVPWQMHPWAILSLCGHQGVHLRKSRWQRGESLGVASWRRQGKHKVWGSCFSWTSCLQWILFMYKWKYTLMHKSVVNTQTPWLTVTRGAESHVPVCPGGPACLQKLNHNLRMTHRVISWGQMFSHSIVILGSDRCRCSLFHCGTTR